MSINTKQTFIEFLIEFDSFCEVVYFDEDGNQLNEGSIRAFKRFGQTIKRYYRCTSGAKEGRLVAEPKSCLQRKDPQKVRSGRKIMRKKKAIINQKAKRSKRKALSKLVRKKNKILSTTHKMVKNLKDS